MTELDLGRLVTPDPHPARLEAIRRRGRRLFAHPGAARPPRAEAALVAVFSVVTLVWAAAAVVHVG